MQERLAGGRVAIGDHSCDVGLQSVQVIVVERFESVIVGGREFGPVCFEFVESLGEFGDAGRAGLLGHRLVFERVEVAVEGVVGLAYLGVEAFEFGFPFRFVGVEFGEGVLDLLADLVFAAEQVGELVEDRLFQLVGGKAVGVAGGASVALAAEADVVAIAAAVAVGGSADITLLAPCALHESGEQVVGIVGAAQRMVFAALFEDRLRAREQGRVDERLVWCRVIGASEEDLSEVGAIAQDRQDGLRVEQLALLGPVAALGEPAADRLCSL